MARSSVIAEKRALLEFIEENLVPLAQGKKAPGSLGYDEVRDLMSQIWGDRLASKTTLTYPFDLIQLERALEKGKSVQNMSRTRNPPLKGILHKGVGYWDNEPYHIEGPDKSHRMQAAALSNARTGAKEVLIPARRYNTPPGWIQRHLQEKYEDWMRRTENTPGARRGLKVLTQPLLRDEMAVLIGHEGGHLALRHGRRRAKPKPLSQMQSEGEAAEWMARKLRQRYKPEGRLELSKGFRKSMVWGQSHKFRSLNLKALAKHGLLGLVLAGVLGGASALGAGREEEQS